MERQFATAGSVGTADVLGLAIDGDSANVQVLQVRDGVLQDRQSFFLDTAGADDEATVLMQFAYEYYALALAIPALVVIPQDSAAESDLEALLSERRGSRVEVRASERGDKRKLAELAARNARFALDQDRRQHEQARSRRRDALADLQERLGLPAPPMRIECYDISNLGETYAVASMVVFEGGAPGEGPLPHLHDALRRAGPTTSPAWRRPCSGASPGCWPRRTTPRSRPGRAWS